MKQRFAAVGCALLALALPFAAGSCAAEGAATDAACTGVWADRDCELLRTERFALLFERCDSVIAATLIGTDAETPALLGRVLFARDSVVELCIGGADPVDAGTVHADGRLHIAGRCGERCLERIEELSVVDPYPMLHASARDAGSCMQQWNLGTHHASDEESVLFEAGTNRHSYAFILQAGFVYCRAARLRFNDRGGLFAQNIRLMSNAREWTAYMTEDNLAESAAPLTIDDGKFSPDRCVFAREGIYWSFIRFEQDTAVLHGCGEEYRFVRPEEGGEGAPGEWFAFEKY